VCRRPSLGVAVACEAVANTGERPNAPADTHGLGSCWPVLTGIGAGDGNRTHVSSLGSYSSTIELRPPRALILFGFRSLRQLGRRTHWQETGPLIVCRRLVDLCRHLPAIASRMRQPRSPSAIRRWPKRQPSLRRPQECAHLAELTGAEPPFVEIRFARAADAQSAGPVASTARQSPGAMRRAGHLPSPHSCAAARRRRP
jgi:hypothetical protein